MALKTIKYTITSDGVTPITEQAGGMQGEHNVTEVEMTLGTDVPTEGDVRYRVQTVDGAGGFYSTEFLTPSNGKITFLLNRDITNAGGVAYLYLVATKVVYEGEKFVSESQEFLSKAMRLRFENSGVGSPSENAYRWGIAGALEAANIFAESAQDSAETAKGYKDECGELKDVAVNSAQSSLDNANNSKIYKDNAESSAIEARGYAEDAGGFALRAGIAKKNAEDAQQTATNANLNAQSAKKDAETAKASAETAKADAANFASNAGSYANHAREYANAAGGSATLAIDYAKNASSYAEAAKESADKAASDKQWMEKNIGDISNALKEIIALQELYIGGDN